MDSRYTNNDIAEIWSTEKKLSLWQKTELAVIEARVSSGKVPKEAFQKIMLALDANAIDIGWWKKRDAEIHHDLNAFIDERLRFIPQELHQYFHKRITSYDTEEPAFGRMISESLDIIWKTSSIFQEVVRELAIKHRYTIMNGRTHGQEAELQTFGKRCLAWYADFQISLNNLIDAAGGIKYSKLSGAIGSYGSIDPETERKALAILGFEPFYGATQIMPREIYAPVANALAQIVETLNKIALAIRLGARSGRPIFHEPFAKKQKGSSAMPHKKNTIITEQLEGMARMARGYSEMITCNIQTWEERAIEQSCVERVAWPDLFHVVVHSMARMTKVLGGLVVYPDNMLLEIVESRGCYASNEAKEFLKEEGAKFGLSHEDAYRIIQLAAFNAFAPSDRALSARRNIPQSLADADLALRDAGLFPLGSEVVSIRELISLGKLVSMPDQLEATNDVVWQWNKLLGEIFSNHSVLEQWRRIFEPSYLLKNETTLYREIL